MVLGMHLKAQLLSATITSFYLGVLVLTPVRHQAISCFRCHLLLPTADYQLATMDDYQLSTLNAMSWTTFHFGFDLLRSIWMKFNEFGMANKPRLLEHQKEQHESKLDGSVDAGSHFTGIHIQIMPPALHFIVFVILVIRPYSSPYLYMENSVQTVCVRSLFILSKTRQWRRNIRQQTFYATESTAN